MYLKMDSIQCASRRQAAPARARARASAPSARSASARSPAPPRPARPGWPARASGPRAAALGMRQHDGQGAARRCARIQLRQRRQLLRLRRPQRALAVVEQARRIEQDHADIGRRRAATRRASRRAPRSRPTPRSPAVMGSRASTCVRFRTAAGPTRRRRPHCRARRWRRRSAGAACAATGPRTGRGAQHLKRLCMHPSMLPFARSFLERNRP